MSVVLSVVVPVRDVAPWIEEQLDCILRQVDDLEVIVIDDHSEDDTVAIVRRIAAGDARVRLHQAETSGGAAARNFGIEIAEGEYIAFADGDDLVPDGAYRHLLDAIEDIDGDLAIGRHLKFSSGATWEPMSAWYDVTTTGLTNLRELPSLLANRACWNRMFRTEFLRAAQIRFPDVPRSNDIVPMVRALVAASRIAMVSDVVYLYRQRPGASSMTSRARSIEGVLSYLSQEREVAARLADEPESVRRTHGRVVLDADGWVHLRDFLLSGPPSAEVDRLLDAVAGLLKAIDTDGRDSVTAERRVLWGLLAAGAGAAAVRFVAATHEAEGVLSVPLGLLDSWVEAMQILATTTGDVVFSLDRALLINDGPWSLLANRAEHSDVDVLRSALRQLTTATSGIEGRSEVLRGVAAAVNRQDVASLQLVSTLRHLAPLVVDGAAPDENGLTLGGPFPERVPDEVSLALVLTNANDDVCVRPLELATSRWTVRIGNQDLVHGRHRSVLRVSFRGVDLDLPVVTARMPLPPVGDGVQLQPLADRADGWRFLVDRRSSGRSLRRRILGAVRNRVRR